MTKKTAMGVIFANVHDEMIRELTGVRPVGSVPFGCRYRVIDFTLSNLVNAGISKIGILTRENYRSLMDHIGSGKPWDLDRKASGVFMLPPFSVSGSGMNVGHLDSLFGMLRFIKESTERLVVLYDANIVCNADIADMIDRHLATGADVTVTYKHGRISGNSGEVMSFSFTGDRITGIKMSAKNESECDHGLDIIVINRDKLIQFITEASENNYTSLYKHILQPNVGTLNIYGYEIKGYSAVMDSISGYFKANMDLLDPEVRAQLFDLNRPIYTKTRDNMPARYGLNADVRNSLVADGCIIDGTVRNSLLFRNVHIGRGAVVENCIIMQDGIIGEGARLQYVATDKGAIIGAGKQLSGDASYPMVITKGARVE